MPYIIGGAAFNLVHWGFHDVFLSNAIGLEYSAPLAGALYLSAFGFFRNGGFGMIRFYALFGAIIGQGVLRARQDGKIQQHFNRYWWTTNDPEERKAAK